MEASATDLDLAGILQEMVRSACNTPDMTKQNLGDPFAGLTDEDCVRLAKEIAAIDFSGYRLFPHGMTLVWTKVGGKLRMECIAQGEQYAAILTAVNKLFQEHGVMPAPAMIFE